MARTTRRDGTASTVLVLGATGRQGSAVVDALTGDEFGFFDVVAGTRNPASDAAEALRSRGVSVVPVGSLHEESLVAAMADADAVFAVTTFFEVGHDADVPAGEERLGFQLTDFTTRLEETGFGGTPETTAR